jgi:hypothetical protein
MSIQSPLNAVKSANLKWLAAPRKVLVAGGTLLAVAQLELASRRALTTRYVAGGASRPALVEIQIPTPTR